MINRMIRSACALSCLTHQARSSKAEASNSKLLNDCLERNSGLTLCSLCQAFPHPYALQKICCFPFGFNFPPEFNGHDHRRWFTALAGDKVDLCVHHAFRLIPTTHDINSKTTLKLMETWLGTMGDDPRAPALSRGAKMVPSDPSSSPFSNRHARSERGMQPSRACRPLLPAVALTTTDHRSGPHPRSSC